MCLKLTDLYSFLTRQQTSKMQNEHKLLKFTRGRLALITLILLGIFSTASAQVETILVTGTVSDESGIPLPGANVIEKGTNNGTITNFDGEFELEVDSTSELEISFLGYTPQTFG